MPRRPKDPNLGAQKAAIAHTARPAKIKPVPIKEAERPASVNDLLDLWFNDIESFAAAFDLRTKQMDVVPFVPSEAQLTVLHTLASERLVQVLKGRQMWVTTATVICCLRECLQNPGMRACVAAHDERSAMEISSFYRQMHAGNPALVSLMPTVSKGAQKIEFSNGSSILFGTANSEFWRGFPTHFAHLTEAALYDNLGATLASLGQTVPSTGKMVLETTANGENDFYQMWVDPISRWKKVFLCWLTHPEYVLDEPLPDNLTEFEREYISKHKIPAARASWWVRKHREMPRESRHLIMQEYPTTPQEAFRMSGDRFLRRPIVVPHKTPVGDNGICIFEPYDPTHQYGAGIDVASGSEKGDYSTIVIGDFTIHKVVATLQIRLPTAEFKILAKDFLGLYRAPVYPLTNPEVNSYGMEIADYLRDEGLPLYRRLNYSGATAMLTESYGFQTNPQTRPILFGAIYESCIGVVRWKISCARLGEELNSLCFDRDGKPGAPKNGHDDLAFAFGLMLLTEDQALPPERQVREQVKELSVAEEEWKRICEMGSAALTYLTDKFKAHADDFWD